MPHQVLASPARYSPCNMQRCYQRSSYAGATASLLAPLPSTPTDCYKVDSFSLFNLSLRGRRCVSVCVCRTLLRVCVREVFHNDTNFFNRYATIRVFCFMTSQFRLAVLFQATSPFFTVTIWWHYKSTDGRA